MWVIGNLILSILWALVITIILLIILHFLMKSLFPRYNYTFSTILILIIATIILFWQSIQLVGAFYVKDYVNDMSEVVSGFIKNGEKLMSQDTYSLADLENIKRNISENYPFLQEYINGMEMKDLHAKGVLQSIKSAINKEIHQYMWIRVGWAFLCWVVAFGGLYYTSSTLARKTKKTTTRRRNYDWD